VTRPSPCAAVLVGRSQQGMRSMTYPRSISAETRPFEAPLWEAMDVAP
jgi:hypothetical protein